MGASFEEFTRAVATGRARAGPAPEQVSRVAVLGGGADARLIAALCLAEGAGVTLFSAYGAELDLLRASSGITLRGDGPVGTYQIDRETGPSIRTTAELDRAVQGAQAIFLTGPVHKQRTYAMVLADHLADGQSLVLAPGRSFGALETAWLLGLGGCRADVTIIEAQTLPYWTSGAGAVLTLSAAAPAPAATLPRGREAAIGAMMPLLTHLEPREGVLASSFADGSGLVEIPALMLGGAGLAPGIAPVPMGGTPLPENDTFAARIGPHHRAVIGALARERRAAARAFGVRDLPDDDTWIARHAGATRGAGARPMPDHAQAAALLRDGVIGSLAPLASAAAIAGIETPVTRAMMTLAGAVLGADVAAAGRRLDTIGIDAGSLDDARRAIDAIMTGGRR